VVGTALKVINAVLTAYAFAYLRFPFKKVLFFLVLGAMMVPRWSPSRRRISPYSRTSPGNGSS